MIKTRKKSVWKMFIEKSIVETEYLNDFYFSSVGNSQCGLVLCTISKEHQQSGLKDWKLDLLDCPLFKMKKKIVWNDRK